MTTRHFSEAIRPLSASQQAVRWATGVTTAPRKSRTIERCLRSLAAAGWDRVRVFAEPGALIPGGVSATVRASRMGAWPNWYLSLAELVMLDPQADYYFIAQDDAIFCRHTREFFERDQLTMHQQSVFSLYCPAIYHSNKRLPDYGPHEVCEGFGLVGALTYIFPAAAATSLLRDANVVDHRLKGNRRGLGNIDAVVGRWADQTGHSVRYYSPSLADHIGDTSAIWPNQTRRRSRTCTSFLGEDFDARNLLDGIDNAPSLLQ